MASGPATCPWPQLGTSMPNRGILSRLAERLTDQLETPALDDRTYRVVRLSNNLEALLCHDPDTDKASAAMDVNVGSFSDRDDLPGMAHAVEHLLFMGTEKYPTENDYAQYLTSHSGSSNAYTAATSTNYFFEVDAMAQDGQRSPFYGALDRFAQFFIAPLFLESTLERELQAVDSENKKNLQSDMWRLHQLSRSTSNPKHPCCHFSTGSLETLRDEPRSRGVDVRREFMRFHEQHYSANRMKLVVLGRESLDELEAWVVELFSGIRNQDLPQNRWDGVPVLTEKQLLTLCRAKPVMDTRLLLLTIPFLDEEHLYESQPSRYVGHLIGHEGPGGILAYIKDRGWATELSAGNQQICPGAALFEISVRLTEEGFRRHREIVKVIFQYMSLLREQGPLEWIVDEMKGMAEVNFRFRQKTTPGRFTSRTSSVMQKPLPRQWLLSGSSLIRKFDADAIGRALACLRPDNFRLTLISHDYGAELDRRERWYGTEYRVDPIPDDFLDEIRRAAHSTAEDRLPALHLPHRNAFIPTKLQVERKATTTPLKAPRLVRHDHGVRAWWKKDDTFWVPKGMLLARMRNPLVRATVVNTVKATLYCELVNDALVEYAYDAEMAGLGYALRPASEGLDVQISGYNDKMAVLLEKVLATMRDLQVRPDRFAIVKERLLQEYQNWEYQQPFHQIGAISAWLDGESGWIHEQYLAELPLVQVQDVQDLIPQLLGQFHLEVLAHGNLYRDEALQLTGLVQSCLRPRLLPRSQLPIQRSLVIPPGSNFTYARVLKDPSNVNHCIEYLLHVGDRADASLRAKLLLFGQTTEERVFDQLRTKEQLGYVVFSGSRMTATTMAYRILLQSDRAPEYLERRMDALLTDFGQRLDQMTEEKFEVHKRSAIQKRLQKLKNLDQETSRFWQHIDSEYYDFEQVDRDVARLEALSKADIVDFYRHYIQPGSPTRAKLAVHMHAQASAAAQLLSESSSPSSEKAALLTLLERFLTACEVAVDHEKLQRRFEGMDMTQSSPAEMLGALQQHLTADLNLEQSKTMSIIERGGSLMRTMLPNPSPEEGSTPSTSANNDSGKDDGQGASTGHSGQTSIIHDVRDFKASLAVTGGPRPVRELSDYEELSPKL